MPAKGHANNQVKAESDQRDEDPCQKARTHRVTHQSRVADTPVKVQNCFCLPAFEAALFKVAQNPGRGSPLDFHYGRCLLGRKACIFEFFGLPERIDYGF